MASTCLGHSLTLSRVPGGGPAVTYQPSSALSRGISLVGEAWGGPYKAMGLGARHAWVQGGHDAQAAR